MATQHTDIEFLPNYYIHHCCCGSDRTIFSDPCTLTVFVQCEHTIGSFLAGLFRALKPLSTAKLCHRPRSSTRGSDPHGICDEDTRDENQEYRGRTGRVGAVTSIHTQGRRSEAKEKMAAKAKASKRLRVRTGRNIFS